MGGPSHGPRAIKLLTDLREVEVSKTTQTRQKMAGGSRGGGASDGPRAIFLANWGEVVQSVQCHIWTTQL